MVGWQKNVYITYAISTVPHETYIVTLSHIHWYLIPLTLTRSLIKSKEELLQFKTACQILPFKRDNKPLINIKFYSENSEELDEECQMCVECPLYFAQIFRSLLVNLYFKRAKYFSGK